MCSNEMHGNPWSQRLTWLGAFESYTVLTVGFLIELFALPPLEKAGQVYEFFRNRSFQTLAGPICERLHFEDVLGIFGRSACDLAFKNQTCFNHGSSTRHLAPEPPFSGPPKRDVFQMLCTEWKITLVTKYSPWAIKSSNKIINPQLFWCLEVGCLKVEKIGVQTTMMGQEWVWWRVLTSSPWGPIQTNELLFSLSLSKPKTHIQYLDQIDG